MFFNNLLNDETNMELKNKANNYAVEKTNEVLIQAIAQAYIDGYQDGYKDCREEIPVDFQNDKTEYVDLGLPSGTLWSADYEKEDGKIKYLPYDKISALQIPTEEQWKELLLTCRWEYKYIGNLHRCFICIGPNGNVIHFNSEGFLKEEKGLVYDRERCFWWVKDENGNTGVEKNAVKMYFLSRQYKEMEKTFSGYKLPVRLVR